MVHDWRGGWERRPGKAFDAATGEPVHFFFFWDEETGRVGRFLPVTGGVIAVHPSGCPVEVWEFRKLRVEWNDEADAAHVVAAGEPDGGA